jgi:hypothetical protein
MAVQQTMPAGRLLLLLVMGLVQMPVLVLLVWLPPLVELLVRLLWVLLMALALVLCVVLFIVEVLVLSALILLVWVLGWVLKSPLVVLRLLLATPW